MAMTKLGNYIELREILNTDLTYGESDVRGVNTSKIFMSTRVDLSNRDLRKFQIVSPGEFVFNHRTSRNGSKLSIAYNDTDCKIICTEDYVVFRIRENCRNQLLTEWLYMFFNRPEFDRYAITNSWGSSTEFFNWEDMCDIGIDLPPLPIQQKYVNIYNAMLANQRSYERGLEDLKLVCEAYIEELKKISPIKPIGSCLLESDHRNDMNLGADDVRGLSTSKEMIPTIADLSSVNLQNYKTVLPRQIAYVPDTSRRGDKMSLGYNDTHKAVLVSSISIVFGTDESSLLPEYLMLFLSRAEFDRYARFNSWGSARETFVFSDMCDVKIPLPDITVQKSISDIFTSYKKRKNINEKLQAQIKSICPILIKGSLEEGRE